MANSFLDEEENYIETEYDCNDFSPKGFKNLINDIMKQNYLNVSTRDLAVKVGMEYEMFRKTVNQNKPSKKRDFIIALGIALNANEGQINELLEHYRFMSPLNSNNHRDEFICRKINVLRNYLSVSEMNNELRKNGFEELDIQDKRKGKKEKKDIKQKAESYRVIKNKVKTRIGEYNCYGDQYNSLCTTYNPERCECYGTMIIERIKDKALFQLDSDGEDNLYFRAAGDVLAQRYNSCEDDKELKDYYLELNSYIYTEKNRLLKTLDDTKNYQRRYSARLVGESICYFVEEFDYSIPEYNDYILLSLMQDKYELRVYNQSAFMNIYLGEKKYQEIYSKKISEPVKIFDSEEQIDKLLF